jgi:predicted ATPase
VIKLGFGLDNYNSLVPSYFSIPDFQEAPDAKRGKAEATRFQIKHPREPIKGDTTYFAPSEGVSTVIKEPGTELRRLNENQWEESGVPSVVVLEGLLPKGFTHESGTSRPVNPAILKEVGFLFDNVTYLRASRRRPFRSYPKELGQPQRIGYGGEWTATILQEKNNVIYADLPALPRPQRVKPKVRYEYSTKQSTLTGAVKAWLKHLGIARSVKSSKSENDRERLKLTVALTGQEPHNLTEVGFGISQVLPVLAAGLLQEEGSLFVVDLPEAHLHPKPQAELADFFCALALSGRHSLVETHSEMFFHRLRLRAEMIPELKKHIAVYFLDAASENLCCAPRPVGLELDSETDWPAGFFQEGWEMEVQLGMLRRARKH